MSDVVLVGFCERCGEWAGELYEGYLPIGSDTLQGAHMCAECIGHVCSLCDTPCADLTSYEVGVSQSGDNIEWKNVVWEVCPSCRVDLVNGNDWEQS